MTSPAPARRPRLDPLAPTGLALVLALLAVLTAGPAESARYAKGEMVTVTGIVADAKGEPLPGVEVVLSGQRRGFDVWSLKRTARGRSDLTAITDDQGSYSIDWRWDSFYNRFEVAAGIRQRIGGEEKWWEMVTTDLTRAIKRGSPVVANLTIERADEVRSLQAFVEGLESADARRVYQELGKPDKVRKIQLPRHEEVTWWYFERGMMYRFVDGGLVSSESFEPVKADQPAASESTNGAL